MSSKVIRFNIVESNPPEYSDNIDNIFEIIPNIPVLSTYANSRVSYKLTFQTNLTYTSRFYINDQLKILSSDNTLLLDYTLAIIQKTTVIFDYNPVILKINVTNSSGEVVRGTVSFTIKDIKFYSPRVFNNNWLHALSINDYYNYFKIEPLLPKSDSDLLLQALTFNSITVDLKFTSIGSGTYELYFDNISIIPQINGTTTISLNNTNKNHFYIWTKTNYAFTLNIQIKHNFTLELGTNIYKGSFLNKIDDIFTGLTAYSIVTIDSTSNIHSIGGDTERIGSRTKDAIVEINVLSQTNPVILLECDYNSNPSSGQTKINLTLDTNIMYSTITTNVINQTIPANTQIVALKFTKTVVSITNLLNPFIIQGVDFSKVDIYIDQIKHTLNNTIVFHLNKATEYKILILNKTGVATNVYIDCSDNVSVIIHDDMYGVQLPNSVKLIDNASNEIKTVFEILYTIINVHQYIHIFDFYDNNNSIYVKPDITRSQSNILVTFTESAIDYKYYINLIIEQHIPTTITHNLPFSGRFFRISTESISTNTSYRYLGFYGHNVGELGAIFNEIELTLGTPLNGFNSIKYGVNNAGITFHESKLWQYKVKTDLTTIMNGNKDGNQLQYKTIGQSAAINPNIIAFHHGNFDTNDYGDANAGAAALKGRFYANTTTPFNFAGGTLNSVSMTNTATTYTWTPPLSEVIADVLMVAGGGGGGNINGGGGGAGGLIYLPDVSLNIQKTIVVGNGGNASSKGNNTLFDSIISIGGGAGGINLGSGGNGGSGGGAGRDGLRGLSQKSSNEFGNDGGGSLTSWTINNWYSLFNKINSTFPIDIYGIDPNIQLQLNSRNFGGSITSLWYDRPIQNASFVAEFEVFISASNNYWAGDGSSFNVGFNKTDGFFGEGPNAPAFSLSFQAYQHSGRSRGIYLFDNNGTQRGFYAYDIVENVWRTVRVVYNRNITNTWQIFFNNINVINYNNPNNETWITMSAGSIFGFGSRTGGATHDFYLRRFTLTSNFNGGGGGGGGAGGTGGVGGVDSSGNGGIGKNYSDVFGTTYGDNGWFAEGGDGYSMYSRFMIKHTGNGGSGDNIGSSGIVIIKYPSVFISEIDTIYWYMDLGLTANVSRGSFWTSSDPAIAFGGGKLYGTNTDPSTFIEASSTFNWNFICNLNKNPSTSSTISNLGFGKYMYYSYLFSKPPTGIHNSELTLNLINYDHTKVTIIVDNTQLTSTTSTIKIENKAVSFKIKTLDLTTQFNTSFNYQWKYQPTTKSLESTTSSPLNLLADSMGFFTAFLSTSSPTVAIKSLQLVPSTNTLSVDVDKGLVYRTKANLENFTLTATYTIKTTIDTKYENNTIVIDIYFTIPEHAPVQYTIPLPTTNILTVAKNDNLPLNFYQAWKFNRPISSDNLHLKALLNFQSDNIINAGNLKVKLLNGNFVVASSGNLQTARIYTFTRAEIVKGTYNYTIRLNHTNSGNIINYALNEVVLNETASGSSSAVVQSISPTAKIGLSIKAQRGFKVDITEINKDNVQVTLLKGVGDVVVASSGNLQTARIYTFTYAETNAGLYNYIIRLIDTITGNISNYALNDVVLIDHPMIINSVLIDTGTELGDYQTPLNQLSYITTTNYNFVYKLSNTDFEIQYDYIQQKWIASGLLSVTHNGSSVIIKNATFNGLNGSKLLASFSDPYYADSLPTIILPTNPSTTNLTLSVTKDGLSFSLNITGIYDNNIIVQLLKGDGVLVMDTEKTLDLNFTNAKEVYLLSTNDKTIGFILQTSIDLIKFKLNANQYGFSIRDILRTDFGAETTYTHSNFASTALTYDSTSSLYKKIDLYRPTNTTVSFFNKIAVSSVPINNLQITLTGISPIQISNFHKYLLNVSFPIKNSYAVYQITPGNTTGSTFDNIGAVTFNIKNDRTTITDNTFLSCVNVDATTGDVRKDYQLFQNFRSINYVDVYGRDISNLSSYSNGNVGTAVNVNEFMTALGNNGWSCNIDYYQSYISVIYPFTSWYDVNDKTIAVNFFIAGNDSGYIQKDLPLGTKEVIIQYYNPMSASGSQIYCNIYNKSTHTIVATNTQQSGLSQKPGETILTIPDSSSQHRIEIIEGVIATRIAIEYIICVFEEDVPPSPQLTYNNITTLDYDSDTTFKLVLLSPQADNIIVEIFRNPTIDDCQVFLRRTSTQQPIFNFINSKKSTETTGSSTCASNGINHFIPKLSKDMYFDDKLYFTLYFDFERQHLENNTTYYTGLLKNNMAERYKAYVHKVFYIDVNGTDTMLTLKNGEYEISRNNPTFWFATLKVQIFDGSPNSIFEVAKLCEITTAIHLENTFGFFQSDNQQMSYIFNNLSNYSLHFTLDNFFVPPNYKCELRAYYTNSTGIRSISLMDNLVDNTPVNFTDLTVPTDINLTTRIHVMLVFTSTSDPTEVILSNNFSSALVYVSVDNAVPRFQENYPKLLNKYAPNIEIEAVVLDGLFPHYAIKLQMNNGMIINVLSKHIYSRVVENGKRLFILKLSYADYEEFFNSVNIGNNSLNIQFTSEYYFSQFNNPLIKTTKTITNNKTIDMNYDPNSKTIMSCVIQ